MNLLSPEARFLRDPLFAALVRHVEEMIVNGDATPTELREAVTLAATHVEMRRGAFATFPKPRSQ